MPVMSNWRTWRKYVYVVIAGVLLYLLLWLSWGGGAMFLNNLIKLHPDELKLYAQLLAASQHEALLFNHENPQLEDSDYSTRWRAGLRLIGQGISCRLGVTLEPLVEEVFLETEYTICAGYLDSIPNCFGEYSGSSYLDSSYITTLTYLIDNPFCYSSNFTASQDLINEYELLTGDYGNNTLRLYRQDEYWLLGQHDLSWLKEKEQQFFALWLTSPVTLRIEHGVGQNRIVEYVQCYIEMDSDSRDWFSQAGIPLG